MTFKYFLFKWMVLNVILGCSNFGPADNGGTRKQSDSIHRCGCYLNLIGSTYATIIGMPNVYIVIVSASVAHIECVSNP